MEIGNIVMNAVRNQRGGNNMKALYKQKCIRCGVWFFPDNANRQICYKCKPKKEANKNGKK